MSTPQLGFSFDVSRCSGCMACMSACFDQNDMPGDGSTFRHVSRVETGTYPSVSYQICLPGLHALRGCALRCGLSERGAFKKS